MSPPRRRLASDPQGRRAPTAEARKAARSVAIPAKARPPTARDWRSAHSLLTGSPPWIRSGSAAGDPVIRTLSTGSLVLHPRISTAYRQALRCRRHRPSTGFPPSRHACAGDGSIARRDRFDSAPSAGPHHRHGGHGLRAGAAPGPLRAQGGVRVAPGGFSGGPPAPALARFAELVAGSRLDAQVSARIEPIVWARLAVAWALNPPPALTGRTHGTLLETPEPCHTLLKAAREVGALAQVKGIDLGGDPAILAVQAAESTASSRSGITPHLERGAQTQWDATNGAVAPKG